MVVFQVRWRWHRHPALLYYGKHCTIPIRQNQTQIKHFFLPKKVRTLFNDFLFSSLCLPFDCPLAVPYSFINVLDILLFDTKMHERLLYVYFVLKWISQTSNIYPCHVKMVNFTSCSILRTHEMFISHQHFFLPFLYMF